VTNYITKDGVDRLQAELIRLRTVDRPKIVREVADAAAQGDRSENAEYIYGKKKLREIDRRMHWLVKRIDAAEVLDPKARAHEDRVFFGATVDLEDEDGNARTLQIVGVDEVDADHGKISYVSPLGRAMLKRKTGESFAFKKPNGEIEYTILAVRYE
jgi:transcription elongation factor GreB